MQISVTDANHLQTGPTTEQDTTPHAALLSDNSQGLSEEEERTLAMLERELLMLGDSEEKDGDQEKESSKEVAAERSKHVKFENLTEAWPEGQVNLVERGDNGSSDGPEVSTKAERAHRLSSKVPEVAKRQTSRSPARSGIPTFQRSSSGNGRPCSPGRSRLPLASPESRPVNGVNICNRNDGGESVLKGDDPEKKEGGDLAWEVNISEITGRARKSKKRTCEWITFVRKQHKVICGEVFHFTI